MADTCPLEITQSELDKIRKCEAVIVREYERDDGSRFAAAVAWGDRDEMEAQNAVHIVCVVRTGLTIVCQRVIAVAELLC